MISFWLFSLCYQYTNLQIKKQQSPNPFEGHRFATEYDSNTSIEPKVTTSSSKKEQTDNRIAVWESENDGDVKNHFKGIPIDFLEDLNEIFEQLNITNLPDAVDFDFDILSKKLIGKGRTNFIVLHLLRQWRKAMLDAIEQQKRIEEEIERKIRSRRPVWRSAVCVRPSNPGCPVAPYIYDYEDIDTSKMFKS